VARSGILREGSKSVRGLVKWLLLVPAICLGGCDAKVSEAELQVKEKQKIHHKKSEERMEIVRKIDQAVIHRINNGEQGCDGYILNKTEIIGLFVGKKRIGGFLPPEVTLKYHNDGRLEKLKEVEIWDSILFSYYFDK
jgi:hypothetical protein